MIKQTKYTNFSFVLNKCINYFLGYIRVFLALVIILVISYFIKIGPNVIGSNIKNYIIELSAPVIHKASIVTNWFIGIYDEYSSFLNVYEENIKFKSYLQKAENYKILYEKTKAENLELKKLLNFVEDNNYQVISTVIYAMSHSPMSKNIIIPVGDNEGVSIGNIVVNQHGLIGKVTEIYKNYSRVMLLNDPNFRVSALSVKTRERIIASGNGSPMLEVLFLKEDGHLEDQDIVISSGDGDIPYGLLIGTILMNGEEEEKKIIPFVNISELDYVSVIIKPKKDVK